VPREVQDGEGVRWTCAQAYAGLSEDPVSQDAAQIEGTERFRVICTPSGGSTSVELELPGSWEEEYSDQQLLEKIRDRQR
jgi:hypothetical protein